jgi:hypothetical protein
MTDGNDANRRSVLVRPKRANGKWGLMTAEQRYWWRIALELRMRKSSGDEFQDFFSIVMEKVHGDDFVRVRAFGRRGDKGCDGYLKSSGQVFQCYGALNGNPGRVDYLIAKMDKDYRTALSAIPKIMKEWHMVHNLVDGLPIEAIEKLKELEQTDQKRRFGFIGIEGFAEKIFSLQESSIEDLLGVVATATHARELQASEIRDIIAHLASAADDVSFNGSVIKPVPADKLEINELPGHWRSLIAGGWQNSHLVKKYLDAHHDAMMGEKLAQIFRERYQYLKSQNLPSGSIMSSLYEMVTGVGNVTAAQQVAAQALLAFLFESCDIFEDTRGDTIQV